MHVAHRSPTEKEKENFPQATVCIFFANFVLMAEIANVIHTLNCLINNDYISSFSFC